MPEELRVSDPRTGENVVVVIFPEDMYSGIKPKVVEEARKLGATVIGEEKVYPEELPASLVNVEGDVVTPVPLPHRTIERYGDEPGRGY